jgi:hexosaminidase
MIILTTWYQFDFNFEHMTFGYRNKKFSRVMKIAIFSFAFFVLASFTVEDKKEQLYLIPQPESVKISRGYFDLSSATKVFLPDELINDLGPYVIEKIKRDAGFGISIEKWDKSVASNFIRFEKSDDLSIAHEGYLLEILQEKIVVKAKSYGGMFNAFQTLRQLIPVNANSDSKLPVRIPCLVIQDKPRFEWRGVMIDVARSFQSKAFIMKQIDVMSAYKINKFHWHLADDQGWRIEIKKYPNLTIKGAWRADRKGISWWEREPKKPGEATPIGGFYTQDDIREIVKYAATRNVEIIPEIDIPGHSLALIASYPLLACRTDIAFEVATGGAAPHDALCAGKETTFEFLNNVFREVAGLFPSQYIHMGGDECKKGDWKLCELCNKRQKENNLNDVEELQSYFVTRIGKQINALGKTLIGWDEILSGKGTPGAVIMAWRRNRYTPEVDAPRAGYKTIQSSYTDSYISQRQGPLELEPEGPNKVLPVSKVYNYEPIPTQLTSAEARMILGTEVCLWGETTETPGHCEYMLYPRVLANAEVGWSNPALKDWKRFQGAIESNFKKLDKEGVNYSTSMYNIYASFALDELHNKAMVFLITETDGYDIYYTLNGENPSATATKYNGVFQAEPKALLKAGLFDKNGILLGKISELKLSKLRIKNEN